MFKVGDKVRCIDGSGYYDRYLTKDKIYEVIYVDDPYTIKIYTDNDYTKWFDVDRFKLVNEEETKKKMKFVPMNELEVISVNGIDGIIIPE